MELAKMTSKGQITIPVTVRKLLGLKDGDKVIFVQEGKNIIIQNAATEALDEVQDAFRGLAAENNIRGEQDVVNMVKEIRAERSDEYVCE